MTEKSTTQDIIPVTDISMGSLIRNVQDPISRKRLEAYYRHRDLSRQATFETIAAEFWFHYEVLAAQPIASKDATARVQVLLNALDKFSSMYGTWLEKGEIQKVEKEFKALVVDMDVLLETLRENETKEHFDFLMDTWNAKRDQNISR